MSPPSAAGPGVPLLRGQRPVAAPAQLQPALAEPVGVRGLQARGQGELKVGAPSQRGVAGPSVTGAGLWALGVWGLGRGGSFAHRAFWAEVMHVHLWPWTRVLGSGNHLPGFSSLFWGSHGPMGRRMGEYPMSTRPCVHTELPGGPAPVPLHHLHGGLRTLLHRPGHRLRHPPGLQVRGRARGTAAS